MTDVGVRVLGDRYVLAEQITRAAGSEVWLASDQVSGRRRAVKLFTGRRAADEAWRLAFNRDAKQLESLTHPGVVTTFAAGEEPDGCWLAMAYVEGRPLADRAAGCPSVDRTDRIDRIDALGQVALSVAALHGAGIRHGALQASNVLVDDHNVATLVGFVLGTDSSVADDLRSLRRLVADCLTPDEDAPDEVRRFTDWVATSDPADAAEIGRVALGIAASLRAGREDAVVPVAAAPAAAEADVEPTRRDTERRRMRNRLLIVGAIVVIGGGFLLRFVGEGGGQVTVPSVVDLPVNTATLQLTSAGLKSHEQVEVDVGTVLGSGGTVRSQSPSAGERVKAGTTVTLVIAESGR